MPAISVSPGRGRRGRVAPCGSAARGPECTVAVIPIFVPWNAAPCAAASAARACPVQSASSSCSVPPCATMSRAFREQPREAEVGEPRRLAHERDLLRRLDRPLRRRMVHEVEPLHAAARRVEQPRVERIDREPPRPALSDHPELRRHRSRELLVGGDPDARHRLGVLPLEQRHQEHRLALHRQPEPHRPLVDAEVEAGGIGHVARRQQQQPVEPRRLRPRPQPLADRRPRLGPQRPHSTASA
jgi:hypothetical protein